VRRRSGFTLIEVIMALVVSGIILVAARGMVEAAADDAASITRAAAAGDREANAEQTVRALAERLEISSPGTSFSGEPGATSFASWCDVPAGWQERCSVTIAIEKDSSGLSLNVRTSQGFQTQLRSGMKRAAIRYLVTAASGGKWIERWGDGITAPKALGLILDKDTLIVRIGDRG
jgi:prepilin-type N-terminal cleavage/methylation domain-containing protein